ncbi:MAG TPA: DCC1-like thiol-disulfide oxidoreductase family protein [Vicinamibacterales bacterium]
MSPSEPTLLYDGTCRFCTAQAERLRRLGRGRVRVESAYAPGVRERFPMLPQDGMMGEIKLVDAGGRVLGGAAAIARTLEHGGGPLGLVARLYRLWPIRPIADAGYRVIARYRYHIAGRCDSDGNCRL